MSIDVLLVGLQTDSPDLKVHTTVLLGLRKLLAAISLKHMLWLASTLESNLLVPTVKLVNKHLFFVLDDFFFCVTSRSHASSMGISGWTFSRYEGC